MFNYTQPIFYHHVIYYVLIKIDIYIDVNIRESFDNEYVKLTVH